MKHLGEQELLLFRPLSRREHEEMASPLDDAEVDVYARIFAEEVDKFRPR